jgi:PAS domain S-box-containing protein
MALISILPMIFIGLMAEHILFENIRSERIKTLGRVADAKHDQLVMVLKRANDRAKVLLANIYSQCNAFQFNEACSIQILKLYLLSEQANGATLYWKISGKSVIVGDSAVGNHEIITFQIGQYAKLFGKKGDTKRSYFISATDAFTGYQLAVTYPVSNLQSIFDRPPDTGSMGETFLADEEGYFVTEARFPSVQGHDHPIHAHPMKSCLRGENSEALDLDYRDQSVIHGFRFIPELGSGCIMAHADQKEAFSELAVFETKVDVIALISIAGIIGLSVYLARRFIRLQELQRQNENKFHTLFESAKDFILIFDKSGIIIDINSFGHTQLGYTKEEMLGKRITEFAAPEIAERSHEHMAKLFRDGHILFDSIMMQNNGDEMPVEINAHLVVINGQEVIFSIHRDITERKKMEYILSEREAKYRSVIETSADGFWIVDLRGCLLEVNDAYVRRSGYTRAELLSLRMWNLSANENTERTYARIQKIFRDGHYRYESCHRDKSGVDWPVEIVASYSNIDDGVIFLFIHDITERNKIMTELEQSENKFRVLYDNANDGMHILDMNATILDINHMGYSRLGYTKEEMVGKSITEFVPKTIVQETPQLMAKLMKQGHLTFESAHICKDGKFLPMEINAQIIEQNGQKMFFSINRDITLRKDIENMLAQRLAKYQAVIETSDDGFFIADMQGRLLEVNDAYVRYSGYSREELLTMSVRDFAPKESPGELTAHIAKVTRDGHDRFESYHKTKGGRIWPVEVSANFWNIDDGRIFVFIHDITGRNAILKEIKQSKESLQKILDNAPISTALARPDGRLVYVNESFCNILGYSKEELEKLSIKDVTYQDDQKLTSTCLKDLLNGTIQIYSGEKRYVRKDGDIIWANLTGAVHKDPSGEILLIAQIEDITQRKIVEKKLKESEEKFRLIFENANDGVVMLDMQGHILDLNPQTYLQLGYTKEEMVGKCISEFVTPEFNQGVSERMAKIKNEGYAVFESAHLCKDNSVIPIEVNSRMVEKGGENMVFSINRDITERKQVEKIMLEREALSRAVIERILDN